MWVKICGNTSLTDARLAADAGADALGFVFAKSPRQVTRDQVAEIVPGLPAGIERIGVFVDSGLDEIVATVRQCGLTGVQIHSEAGPELPARLRTEFGAGIRILRVVHFGPDATIQARAVSANPYVDGILIDSRTATAPGGTGIAFDWEQARASLFNRANHAKLIAAGGLSPENVARAVSILRPWGVDVVSGVESAPGRKDPEKVASFVRQAREAAARLMA